MSSFSSGETPAKEIVGVCFDKRVVLTTDLTANVSQLEEICFE